MHLVPPVPMSMHARGTHIANLYEYRHLHIINAVALSIKACSLIIIDVGTRGGIRGMCPQDFASNKEIPFLFLENDPSFLWKKCPHRVRVPYLPKLEMLPNIPASNVMLSQAYFVIIFPFPIFSIDKIDLG